LSAERLRIEGLYTVPNTSDYLVDRDVRQDYYFLNGSSMDRFGADELLAVASSVFRLDSFRVIMALLIAMHLGGIAAVGALVYRGQHALPKALLACGLLAVSALATFGVEYQLLGQAAGLLFMTAAVSVLCKRDALDLKAEFVRCDWLLAGILSVALCEAYPELLPFAILAVIGFQAVAPLATLRNRVALLGITAAATLIGLNGYARITGYVLFARLRPGSTDQGNGLFPYYLLPSGLPNIVGILPVASFPLDPGLSLLIGLSFVVLAMLAWSTFRGFRQTDPSAYLFAVFVASMLYFFHSRSGFALYKLAMYLQPALAAVAAVGLVAAYVRARRVVMRATVVALGAAFVCGNVITQQVYVSSSRASTNSKSASFIEIPVVSESRLLTQLEVLRSRLKMGDSVVSDTFNHELAEVESFYTRGTATIAFPEQDQQFIASLFGPDNVPLFDSSRVPYARSLAIQRDRSRFRLHAFAYGPGRAKFLIDQLDRTDGSRLWLHGGRESPFNRASLPDNEIDTGESISNNKLAFVSSSAGYPYISTIGPISLYQLEPDLYFSGYTMCGIGRYLLFEVLNPTGPLRVRIAFTDTLRNDGVDAVPAVSVVGTQRVFFPASGRGSAAIVSGPVVPKRIGGHSYILLDMGTEPKKFVSQRLGLMQLWGRDIEIDKRSLTAFLRDVSVVDAGFHTKLDRFVAFPSDLERTDAEYSGIYEDGWASDDLSVSLDVGGNGVVHLRGVVPRVSDPDFKTVVSTYVDGFAATSSTVGVGDVDIPVMTGSGLHRIEWRFSRFQHLPGRDQRPATLLVHSIG
jgi:hypothetical protein